MFQIDAHVGNVSDLAFSHPNKQLCVITCGEDKTIKVYIIFMNYLRLIQLEYGNLCGCFRYGMLPLAPGNIFLRVMRHLSIQYALTIKKISR